MASADGIKSLRLLFLSSDNRCVEMTTSLLCLHSNSRPRPRAQVGPGRPAQTDHVIWIITHSNGSKKKCYWSSVPKHEKMHFVSKEKSSGRDGRQDERERERESGGAGEREGERCFGNLHKRPIDHGEPATGAPPLCPCRSCITLYEFNFNREKFSI